MSHIPLSLVLSLVLVKMSLVPSNFEYSPVNNDHDHEDAGDSLAPSPLVHSNRTDLIDTSYSHSNNGTSFNSDPTDAHVDQTQVPPSSHKPAGYKGPPVAGWPTAPRNLSGISIPQFIGDIVLTLLPIAFLGSLFSLLRVRYHC